MIKARLSNGTFILGITADNVQQLKEGKPILVSLGQLGGTDDIMIMYGDTILDIQLDLEAASGKPLPAPSQPKTNG